MRTFFDMVWISITVLIVHTIITFAGLLFVEAEILRCGNDDILDSLQEGVIILSEEDKNEIRYHNRAARIINIKQIGSIDNLNETEMDFDN